MAKKSKTIIVHYVLKPNSDDVPLFSRRDILWAALYNYRLNLNKNEERNVCLHTFVNKLLCIHICVVISN